jgi:subtilase family serine protease
MYKLRTGILVLTLLLVLSSAFSFPEITAAQPTEWEAKPFHNVRAPASVLGLPGYAPTEIRAAYNLPASGGSGTIAIIDAYDNPNVATNLETFSGVFGLPSASLEVHKMNPYISANVGWGVEIALDVQWAHAIAPAANILLVEAASAYLSDLLSAVNYARNRADVVAISMSWGGSEFFFQTFYDSYFTSPYGASFFASSGDSGAGVSWPSSSINVVSVGGTTLSMSGGTVTSEKAWTGSGGGVSTYEPKPTYQNSLTSYLRRATPDVSYNADPNTGFAVYDTYGYGGWLVVGGTSAGAPQWAAIYALGASASNTNFYADYKQSYSSYFRDITQGSNGYSAGTGYDLATGLGSPITTNFASVPPPPPPDFSLSASPNPISVDAGASGTTTVTVAALNRFTETVSFSTTVPTGWTATPNPATISGSGASTLTITVPSTAATGTYSVVVTGTSGATIHTVTVNVQATGSGPGPASDFSLTATPKSQNIKYGGTGNATVTVNSLNSYSGSVSLAASAPMGVTCAFSATPVPAGNSATMTITISRMNLGTSFITITGTDTTTGVKHTNTINVTGTYF